MSTSDNDPYKQNPQYPQGGQGYPQGGPQYPQGGQGYPQGGQGYPQGGQGYPQGGQGYPTPPQFNDQGAYGAPVPSTGQPGELLPRFGARFIDGLIVGIPTAIIVVILGIALGTFGNILGTILSAGASVAYFTYLESSRGQTFGKQILGLRTVGPNGGNPTQEQAFKRNSFYLLGIIPFFIGNLLLLVAYIIIAVTINSSPTKQGKHDEFAGGTRVVKV